MEANDRSGGFFRPRSWALTTAVGASLLGACDPGTMPAEEDLGSRPAAQAEGISGTLLYREQLSPTASVSFYELEPGIVGVNVKGHMDQDAQLANRKSVAGETLADMFKALNPKDPTRKVPPALIAAQKRVDEFNAKWNINPAGQKWSASTGEDTGALKLDPGPQPRRVDHHTWDWAGDFNWFKNNLGPGVGGDFGACNTWSQCCIGCGYRQFSECKQAVDNNNIVEVGGFYDSAGFRSTGMSASFHTPVQFKTYYRSCTNYILWTSCSWKLVNGGDLTVQPRFWSQWNFGGIGHYATVQSWWGEQMRAYAGMETNLPCGY